MTQLTKVSDRATQRLNAFYEGKSCHWSKFFRPRWERSNFASRYHLVYPALAYFIMLKKQSVAADAIRPKLDNIYSSLIEERVWKYWHSELNEPAWPLQERNLTYAGRLATFVGFYIDAFDDPPSPTIEVDGHSATYTELSQNLQQQMISSPSCGVTCYHHQAMVMCNAHMLINNLLHDRLFGTSLQVANEAWFTTVTDNLLTGNTEGPLFFLGTESKSATPDTSDTALGSDAWTLFLMSAVFPERVREWFTAWEANISHQSDRAFVVATEREEKTEQSSTPLATAWAFCLAKELGDADIAAPLRKSLTDGAQNGFELDPLVTGLYVLGENLTTSGFRRLVVGE